MSAARHFGGKLARSLPSPADFFSGGGLARLGRLAAGSAMASANLAAETLHLGTQTAARNLGSAAARAEGVLPGSGLVRKLAGVVDREAARGAEVARRQAADSLGWMAGEPQAEASAEAPPEIEWTELVADTAAGPLRSLLAVSLSLGSESIQATAGTRPGRLALDAALDRLSSDATLFDSAERRESFVAVATDSGASAIREIFALAEAAARLAGGDTRQMRRTIEAGLEDMQRLVASADMQELLPAPMVSERLQERARLIIDRAPEQFLEALGEDSKIDSQGLGAVATAAFADAGNLRVFLAVYPQVLILVGTDVGKLLMAGSISFSELEAFMEGRRRLM